MYYSLYGTSYVHAYSLSDKYKIKVGMVNVLLVVFKKHECLTIVARKTVCVHEKFPAHISKMNVLLVARVTVYFVLR